MSRLLRAVAAIAALTFLSIFVPSPSRAADTIEQQQKRLAVVLGIAGITGTNFSYLVGKTTMLRAYDTAAHLTAATPDDGTIGYAVDTDVYYFRINGAWSAITVLATMANGATIDNNTNNVLAFSENSENLKLTFNSNALALSSSTGVTSIDFGLIAPTFGAIITMTNGGTFSNETNNAFTWAENSENLTLTFGANSGTYTSSTGVDTLSFTGIGLTTTTGVQSASLVTTTLEANLAAGACTAGTWKVDNAGTRELCRCNDGGTAYDCISVTTANGPTD